MPRKRKPPAKLDESGEGHQHESPRAMFRQIYFELLDKAIQSIKDRFDQPGFGIYITLQNIVVKAVQGEPYQHLINEDLVMLYGADINFQMLLTELSLLKTFVSDTKIATISDVVRWFTAHSNLQPLLPQVKLLLRLILVLPATNAVSERSFSALRRLKTYLRSSMSSERLNSLMKLHVYNTDTDNLDVQSVIKIFVESKPRRKERIAVYC